MKQKLMPLFLPDPSKVDLKTKADEFYQKWNFPNCVLAIDGKHVRIQCPSNSGSLFFNYKEYFSIVLLAMVDANYKFIAIDVGSFGREGDSGIFLKSSMGQQVLNCTFGFPEDCALPGTDIKVPHVILGDQAFRLHKHILRPFHKNAYLEKNGKIFYQPDSEEPSNANMTSLASESGFLSTEGIAVRDIFKDYFVNEGAVSWQT
ncbi:hypothetical protein QTP88_019550 [Uroleucon formosanum]